MSKLACWPIERVEEALERLLGVDASARIFDPATAGASERALQTSLYSAASGRGLEVEPLRAYGGEVAAVVRDSAPALLRVQDGLLAVQRVRGRLVTLLEPDGKERHAALQHVCDAVSALWEERYQLRSIDRLLEDAQLAPQRVAHARQAFVRQQLMFRRIEVGWSVRLAASASLSQQLSRSGLASSLTKVALALLLVPCATVLAWTLLGRGLLDGTLDPGWLVAWALALTSATLLHVLSSYWQESVAIAVGVLVKKRLLLGTLRIEQNMTRREGLGLTMGRVLESSSIEDLSLAGGFLALSGLAEFVIALLVLASVAWYLAAVSLLFLLVALGACALYGRRAQRWAIERVRLTHGLIERLVGARTRSVQEDPGTRHDDEDSGLTSYAHASCAYDRATTFMNVLLQRGTLLVGLFALSPLFVYGDDPALLWMGMGGILLMQRALTRVSIGLPPLASAAVAWRSAAPLFRAAGHAEQVPTATGVAGALREIPARAPLLQAHNVQFRFDSQRQPVLRGVALDIRCGDRILVEGGSGSGKSTLASLVAGIHNPEAGLLLLGGLDRGTLGAAGWRKRVAASPQFHENHIFQGPLAFNLLFGREWPASAADLAEAEQVCEELGFGPVLKRMPSGIMQVVGPAGWRLSHGEQSRIFIARALLQRSDLVVLDESFAALDPESLQLAMDCVRRRARTLMLVAHP